MKYQSIKYFSGLNALRFFAAFLVVLHHAEQVKLKYGVFNLKEFSLFNNGGLAVTFFFVLSGFLITFLLLKEHAKKNTISIRKFYIRRILRIWPLYFLLVLIGTIILPLILSFIDTQFELNYSFYDVFLYYVFFTPFMVNILFGGGLLEPLWSIGVEELFYIYWAPLFKKLKKHFVVIFTLVILIKLSLLLFFEYSDYRNSTSHQVIKILKFEAMAIGGLFSYLIYHSKKEIGKMGIFSKPAQIVILFFILLRIGFVNKLIETAPIFNQIFKTFILSDLLMMLCFVWIIINVSLNPKKIINLDLKPLNFLGEISYGIYMYHLLVIFTVIVGLKSILNSFSPITSTLLFYSLITAGILITSSLSKRFFEDPFLRFKERFNNT
ncbi:MAG: acyltransferase [Polaribacter sp.]|jgi:peptidoglycan/LPS O-acetylase OafA/YrhL|nr:acyltransferase [Polaribacter sp.]